MQTYRFYKWWCGGINIWKIKKLIIKSISDITNISLDINNEYILINKDNSKIYDNNEIVINTDIRNGTELILFKKV